MNMHQVMCLSDLVGKPVRNEEGISLGSVREVRTKNSEITFLICGVRGFLQRMAGFRAGTRVKWDAVRFLDENTIVCRGHLK